jgi:L-lactate dehydrogenase complex protein LldF
MMSGRSAPSFEARSAAALQDLGLRQALARATDRFMAQRRQAFADLPDAGELRQRARAIKESVLSRLDVYLAELAEAVRARGGVVHWARDGAEARAIVVGLARERGVTRVVKSKSMTSEEIGLNGALAAAGIRAVETDLGEWIIQLAGERPSHIIAPAIHKTRHQVADLFAGTLRRPVPPDIEVLTASARAELREAFLAAEMGISGVNFAVARTGTLVLVTNEGNGRMVTSVPPVHVAIMGMEKVVPTLDDLMVFLKILARSATGQKASTYVSLITGTRREGELDGPRELHLVILDNGRSRAVAGPLREALFCIRCGACLNVCPVYRQIGGHAYDTTYPGPIGIVLTSMLGGSDGSHELAAASTLCGACEEVCPLQIRIPEMLLALRAEASAKRNASIGERAAVRLLAVVLAHHRLYRLAARLGRLLQRVFLEDGRAGWLPAPLSRWRAGRDLPRLSPAPFHQRLKGLTRSDG